MRDPEPDPQNHGSGRATDGGAGAVSLVLCTAWYTRPASFFFDENGLVRLALPTAVSLVAFVLVDAYSNPARRWPLKPALQAALAMGFAFLSQASLVRSPELSVPFEVMLVGGAMSLLLSSAIRILFDAGGRHPTGTS